jgi:3-oxoacyl-[acyl-carrier protein] reductase
MSKPQFTAVITGGNKGIGADLADRLLEQGYTVVSVARRAPEKSHDRLFSVEADLLDADAVKQAAATIAKDHRVTHLIHNAGLIWPNLIEDAKPEDITGLAQLHLGSALTLLQAFLPAMKDQHFGRVMFNASRAALGAPTRTAYSASKAGMIGMARTWALELAKHGITVNVVAPGPILTDNFWGIIPKDSDREAELATRIPVGRLGTVEDVTNAFLFFCDPKSSFVTGQTLYVCGGASVGGSIL